MQERYVATADLGSSKIGISVARVAGDDIQVIYYKESSSDGINHGCVYNPIRASRALRAAIEAAEEELKMKITQIVVGLPRQNVRQETATATVNRSDPSTCITKDEISLLKSMAVESYPLNDDAHEEIYGAVAQYFSADDLIQQSEMDVVGSPADTLEGTFKVFVGAKTASSNIDIMLNELGIACADKIFVPHAVSNAVLTDEEKDNGVALVEMGGGVTSLSIYKDRILRYYGAIPFGGKSISTDIKNECGFKAELAESIKIAYGACLPDKLQSMSEKKLQINDNETGTYEILSVKYLSEIITARASEIIEAILYMIQESGYADRLRNGIVLTGGCADTANIGLLIQEMSGYSVRQGYTKKGLLGVDDCPEILETSASASAGLILQASKNQNLNCTGEVVSREEDSDSQPVEYKETLFSDDKKAVEEEVIKPKKRKKNSNPNSLGVRWIKLTEKVADNIGSLFDEME